MTAIAFVEQADQKKWDYVWMSQLRTRSHDEHELARAIVAAERAGLEVRGEMSYYETQMYTEERLKAG